MHFQGCKIHCVYLVSAVTFNWPGEFLFRLYDSRYFTSIPKRFPAVRRDPINTDIQAFDVCIEASGSSGGIELALAVTRPMGTVVLKSTCSLADTNMPQWSAIANDIVVNEKRLMGSRCDPVKSRAQEGFSIDHEYEICGFFIKYGSLKHQRGVQSTPFVARQTDVCLLI